MNEPDRHILHDANALHDFYNHSMNVFDRVDKVRGSFAAFRMLDGDGNPIYMHKWLRDSTEVIRISKLRNTPDMPYGALKFYIYGHLYAPGLYFPTVVGSLSTHMTTVDFLLWDLFNHPSRTMKSFADKYQRCPICGKRNLSDENVQRGWHLHCGHMAHLPCGDDDIAIAWNQRSMEI